jgi:hypothetical protein
MAQNAHFGESIVHRGIRWGESRLAAYDAQHPPGRSEAVRKEIREGRTVFETQMLRAGAIALDGTAPTAMAADELISLAD